MSFGEPSRDYTWQNAQGESLIHIDIADPGLCGWPDSVSMYQPGLEEALAARARPLPGLRLYRGYEAVALTAEEEGVALQAEGRAGECLEISARWVVGCDGANSFIRSTFKPDITDWNFTSDWLTCDIVLNEPRDFSPNNLQVCDPARPTTVVSAGPGHRRWEFMRMPGETIEELDRSEVVWRLLAPYDVTPRNAVLERRSVYTFRARCADQWRSGRVLLAGDAAHLMPPFAGQGMCSGFRDAANLAWKLDLVIAGKCRPELLDTYTIERRAHLEHAIRLSVDLGKVICQADSSAAADRDAAMIAAKERGIEASGPKSVFYPLTKGLLQLGKRDRPKPPAGTLMPQGHVACGAALGLFDDVVGHGFVIMTTGDPRTVLDEGQRTFLNEMGVHLVGLTLGSQGTGRYPGFVIVADTDDVYIPYLTRYRANLLVQRPDFYVFGAARDKDEATALVDDLRCQMLYSVIMTGP